jgi:predicted metal-dependent hydrolase
VAPPRFHELTPATRRALLEGCSRFNAGQFWSAHEAWEEAWLAEDGLTKLWLQALIQLTAAFHKGLVMGHARGMVRLFEQSEQKFTRLAEEGASYGGLVSAQLHDIAQVGRAAAERWAAGTTSGFDRALVPQLPRPNPQ